MSSEEALSLVFIFGLFPDSSGKTVISTALSRELLNRGVKVGVFKPRSGHNLWYQYEVFLKCKSEGRLFCEDIIKLKKASECQLPYEVLNPVDALLAPLNTQLFIERGLTDRMYILEEELHPHLIIERHTTLGDYGKIRNILLLNERSLKSGSLLVDCEYVNRILMKAERIITIHTAEEWAALSNKLASQSICSCYRKVKDEYEAVVIEGYNDAVAPERQIISDIDIAVGVAPGILVIYDADDFRRVLDVMGRLGKDPRTLRSKEVIKYLKRHRILRIPPVPHFLLRNYDLLCERLGAALDPIVSEMEV